MFCINPRVSTLFVILCSFLTLRALAQPTNDMFANRVTLTGTAPSIDGSNFGATTEIGENTGVGSSRLFASVWYSWTAPAGGIVHSTFTPTSSGNVTGIVRFFSGSTLETLTLLPTLSDGSIRVVAGQTVQIQVGVTVFRCSFLLSLAMQVAEPNDAFAGRLPIPLHGEALSSTFGLASTESGEPLPDPTATQTLWWKFTPVASGVVNIGVGYPAWTTLYEGDSFAAMKPVTPLNSTFYPVQAGNEYELQVSARSTNSGGFYLSAHYYDRTNDFFADRSRLGGTNFIFDGFLPGATSEPGEPSLPYTNTVWVSWVPPVVGRASFYFASGTTEPSFQVYTGSSLAALTPVPMTPGAYNERYFFASAGTEYLFQISGPANTFSLVLNELELASCPNDNFADALAVPGVNLTFAPASIIAATMELGEPAHLGSVAQKSIWWKWRAPTYGTFDVSFANGFLSNVVVAAYLGDSVETLQLVAKGTNALTFSAKAGELYHLAAAVETNAIGDVAGGGFFSSGDLGYHPVLGNLLKEPSWEEWPNVQYWHWVEPISVYQAATAGACDGFAWPALGAGAIIWQDIPTIPGHSYAIRFAYRIDTYGDSQIRVRWDTNELGVADVPYSTPRYWLWSDYCVIASNTVSRVSFENLGSLADLDAFSVVDLCAPPSIVTQPKSVSTFAGGTIGLVVGAVGGPPLGYQWFFNNSPLGGQTNRELLLSSIATNQTGNYSVTVTNPFGSVTSAAAFVLVEAPDSPLIVWQPYGDTVPAGGYFAFGVAAVGQPPLAFQWYFDGTPIAGATNRTLVFTNVMPGSAGTYQVTVSNAVGLAWSLPAPIRVAATNQSAGLMYFRNWDLVDPTNTVAPVLDVDGVTPLSGPGFVAQLYAGPSLEWLRPAGEPVPFQTGLSAGLFYERLITLPNVPTWSRAVAQVRAWDPAFGNSYEEARALGGRFGKSEIIDVFMGEAATMAGLAGFSLQAGLPRFASGLVEIEGRQPGGVVLWSVTGEPGYRYLVEKAEKDLVFHPFLVLTNVTGKVTFSDSANSGSALTLYRARILD